MAKLLFATVLVVALAGVAQMQTTDLNGQSAINSAANYAQNLPSQLQNQFGQATNQGQQQPGNGLLSGLLGGNGGSNSGPFETLRQLPARGLQMLNNVFSGVRNMLPLGLGRNANNNSNSNQSQNNPLGQLSPDQLLNNLPKNPVTDLAQNLLGGNSPNNSNGLSNIPGNAPSNELSNGLRLPNLNQITNPVVEPLQQGRLPDINEISRGVQNTVRDLTNGLGTTLNGVQGQGQRQGGLGGLLGGISP